VAETTAADMGRVFETSVLGSVRVLRAFAALLDSSAAPVVVNAPSGLGSLGHASDTEGPYADLNMRAYPASKASLNMRKVQWAQGVPPLADHRRRSWIHRH